MQRIFCLLFSLILVYFYSCTSAPRREDRASNSPPASALENSVPVQVAPPKSRSFFSSIGEDVLNLVEIGSPQSLRRAAASVYDGVSKEYSEAEKTILFLCAEITAIVWPSETVSWVVPEITSTNQYIGAVESAKSGVYDLSTSNFDFLSLVLPSLALMSASSYNISDYYDLSENALKTALSANPNSVLASFLLGTLYSRQNKTAEALELFKFCNAEEPSSKEIQLSLANGCLAAGENELSLSLGEQLLERYPQDLNVLDVCIKSSFALNDFAKTESYVVRALLIDSENAEYVLMRARILIERGDYIRASSLLDAVESRSASVKEYYILRTRVLLEWNRNTAEALETASAALSMFPTDIDILLLAGATASSANSDINGLSAKDLANRVIELDADNTEALTILIGEYVKESNWQSAYDTGASLIGNLSADDDAYYTYIRVCLHLNRTDEALELAARAYTENPANERASAAYIEALRGAGRLTEAAETIERLLPSASQAARSLLYYERSFLQRSEADVLSDLRQSLTANPRNEDALYRLYEIYFNRNDLRRAQYYLRQVVSLDPSNPLYLERSREIERLLAN